MDLDKEQMLEILSYYGEDVQALKNYKLDVLQDLLEDYGHVNE